MMQHKGFRQGDYAVWDPRSDTLIINQKIVHQRSVELSIPYLESLVLDHEFSHRFIYKSPAVQDIVYSTYAFSQILSNPNMKRLPTDTLKNANYTMLLSFSFMDDINIILDALHAYRLVYDYERHHNVTFDELKKYFAVILDKESKNMFNEIRWFNKNVRTSDKVISTLTYLSVFPGMEPFLPSNDRAFDIDCYPSQILFNSMETLQSLHETNISKAEIIFKKLRFPPAAFAYWPRYYNNVITELSRNNPSLRKVILPQSFSVDKHLKLYKTSLIIQILGRGFFKMDNFAQQGPSLIVRQEESGKYIITGRRGEINKTFKLYWNLALMHLQECAYEEADFECYLCELGFCSRTKHQWFVKKLHNEIKAASDNYDILKFMIDS